MKRFGSTPARRCSCAHPARRRARSRSKARSTRWRRPAAWTPWPFGSRTMPRSSRSPASRSPPRRCATATRKAPAFGWERRPLAPRQMRDDAGLLVGWGVGTATFPGADVPGPGQGGAAPRRRRRHGDRGPRHGAGRLDRAGADRGGWAWARHRPGRVPVRHVGPAGCRHRRRLGPYRDRRHGDPQRRRRRDREARRSRDRRRSLAAVRRRQCRRDRARRPAVPPRRREPQRELCRHPRPRGLARDRGSRQRARPIRPRNRPTPCMRMGPCSPRSRSIPDLGQIRATRLVGAFAAGRIINPAHGAQPAIMAE